jgi:hypothetical protein
VLSITIDTHRPARFSNITDAGADNAVVSKLITTQTLRARAVVNDESCLQTFKYLSKASPQIRNEDERTID